MQGGEAPPNPSPAVVDTYAILGHTVFIQNLFVLIIMHVLQVLECCRLSALLLVQTQPLPLILQLPRRFLLLKTVNVLLLVFLVLLLVVLAFLSGNTQHDNNVMWWLSAKPRTVHISQSSCVLLTIDYHTCRSADKGGVADLSEGRLTNILISIGS